MSSFRAASRTGYGPTFGANPLFLMEIDLRRRYGAAIAIVYSARTAFWGNRAVAEGYSEPHIQTSPLIRGQNNMSSKKNMERQGNDAVSELTQGDQVMKVKVIVIAILTLFLCGCQGLKQAGQQQEQPVPAVMTTGNWEFVLQKSDTENIYVESNIASTSTPGSYTDHTGTSTLFSLDSSIYYSDPASGGGYQLGAAVSSFTLTTTSQSAVSGTLNQSGGQSIRFTGTMDPTGMSISGSFDDGSGATAPFTASTAVGLGGNYIDSTGTIRESISGNVIAETSPNGSGNYSLTPSVGNFAFLSSDVPAGGNGSVVFWNNTGVCSGKQCAVWVDVNYNTMWVLMNDPDSGDTQVVATLRPPA